MRLESSGTLRGKLRLPAFFPDATNAKIRAVSNSDLKKMKVDGLVVNIYHLLRKGLIEKIAKVGIHKFMNFNKPIISDSGGFQVMSLIHDNPGSGKITKDGAEFEFDGKKIKLTPEKCIQLQLKIRSDIVMCLDDCTKPEASLKEQEKSVARTIEWARRCKKEFEKKTSGMKNKPLLLAIVQGGESKRLRKKCALSLIKIGFDGYAFGGFPVKEGELLIGILKYVSKLIPKGLKFAMGIGKPQDIVNCFKLGYNMFDCVIPTRDARHKRLYVFTKKPSFRKVMNFNFTSFNVRKKSKGKLAYCDCELCKKIGLKKLDKLFRIDREKAETLASVHNLAFYSKLMSCLRNRVNT